MVLRQLKSTNFITGFVVGFLFFLCIYNLILSRSVSQLNEAWLPKSDGKGLLPLTRNSPLLFIGGWPRSGTTLMRVLVHVHSQVNCGPETRVVPRILSLHRRWMESPFESNRLRENGMLPHGLDAAAGAYMLEAFRFTTEPARIYCMKDPMNLKYIPHLKTIFPNSKFILMVRDGRAVVHSIIKRNVSIAGVDWRNPFNSIKSWERATRKMIEDCANIGSDHCLMVKYENLILHPNMWLEKIMKFLRVPWEDDLLRHWEVINGNKKSIKISKMEKSSSQVINPITLNALSSWATDNVFTLDVKQKLHRNVPLLRDLGYDVNFLPPNYGEADPWVVNQTTHFSKIRPKT